MTLDGTVIFQGEIARACGGILGGTEAFGDVSSITVHYSTYNSVLNIILCISKIFVMRENLTNLVVFEIINIT